jgi:hypothetical protein
MPGYDTVLQSGWDTCFGETYCLQLLHTRLYGVITQNIFTRLSNTIAVARAPKRGLHREWVRFGKAEINAHPKPFYLEGHVKICILMWRCCLLGCDTV